MEEETCGASWQQKLGTIWNSIDPQRISEYEKGYLQAQFYTTGERSNNTKYM